MNLDEQNRATLRRPTKGCGYVARVMLDHGDRVFQPGDLYPYAELGKHEVEAFKMWRAGLLTVIDMLPGFTPGGSFDVPSGGTPVVVLPADTPRTTIHVDTPKRPARRR